MQRDSGLAAYSISKAALNALTLSLAKDVPQQRVKVNSMCPGWVRTVWEAKQRPDTGRSGGHCDLAGNFTGRCSYWRLLSRSEIDCMVSGLDRRRFGFIRRQGQTVHHLSHAVVNRRQNRRGITEGATSAGEYEATGAQLNGDAWICGRTTMQEHFAEPEPFAAASDILLDRSRCMSRLEGKSYAVAVDTAGKLRWSSADMDGDHLISVLSERVSAEYLAMLRDLGISYIVSGDTVVDLVQAVSLLGEHFGIRTLLPEGGGHINGAFLEAGLVDELSLLIAPGIEWGAMTYRRCSMTSALSGARRFRSG